MIAWLDIEEWQWLIIIRLMIINRGSTEGRFWTVALALDREGIRV